MADRADHGCAATASAAAVVADAVHAGRGCVCYVKWGLPGTVLRPGPLHRFHGLMRVGRRSRPCSARAVVRIARCRKQGGRGSCNLVMAGL
jgi:hypothetical protein